MANTPMLGTSGVRDVGVEELNLGALRQNINQIIIALNSKDSAFYQLTEVLNGQSWFPDPALNSSTPQSPTIRQGHRKVINFGALPNNATKTVAHGLTIAATYSFTRIYGAATDIADGFYIPLPYVSVANINNGVELYVTNTDVVVTTKIDFSHYVKTYIVLEYITS